MTLLDVSDLRVAFTTADGVVQAVRGVSFSIDRGETLGIVGESGSGKSVCTQTLVGLTTGAEVHGQAFFEGQDLLRMSSEELRHIRGSKIAMIFQDPLTSLHPLYKVGWQIAELIRAHTKTSRKHAWKRAVELLDLVGIPQPEKRVSNYPHEFSGGMRQRVMIAMALALEPKLIIADEPTTALDATVQAQVLDLMMRLQRELDTALIIITHDLGVVAELTDNVLVMYAGKAVEYAERRTLYYEPHHPYTKGLLGSVPGSTAAKERLQPIPGQPPSLIAIPHGCPFNPRCPYVMDRCLIDEPPLLEVDGEPASDAAVTQGHHGSACWLPAEQKGLAS